MLKITKIKLEKIYDIDMYLFLEKGMIGGISYISKTYSKSKDDIDIMNWDANSLYGWAMGCNYLPYGGFKFLNEEEINEFNIHSIKENSKIGYILQVDLEYCKELHETHNDYPLCPEHISVNYEMLSNYCKNIADKLNIKVGGVKKLIPNLYDKIRYHVHYRNLQYYLKLGIKLIKIHRTLSFKQKNWLKIFTDFNTEKRRKSNDEFNKNLYKPFNNCIYGKSIENVRKRMNIKLVNDKKKHIRKLLISLISYHKK